MDFISVYVGVAEMYLNLTINFSPIFIPPETPKENAVAFVAVSLNNIVPFDEIVISGWNAIIIPICADR